jgi:hypothetical protein
MVILQFNPDTIANTVNLLRTMQPDRAAEGLRSILDAIRNGLERDGLPALIAAEVAIDFGEAVVDTILAARRPIDATVH